MRSLKFDPASRLGFRLQRMWLTPMFRHLLRVGVPCIAVIGAASLYLSQPHVKQSLVDVVTQARASVQERPEFMVHLMAIDGASPDVAETIRNTIPVDLPTSSFDLDLEAMRLAVEDLPAVKDATLRVRSGGILSVDVLERRPVLVWRSEAGLFLLDAEGVQVTSAYLRADHAELPLIVGEGADDVVTEALSVLRAARPLKARVRGLRRMGERRWDLVLDAGQVIQLPEQEPVGALGRVILLDQAQDLLARDITHIDLRNPRRPTLRVAQSSLEELRKIRTLEQGFLTNE